MKFRKFSVDEGKVGKYELGTWVKVSGLDDIMNTVICDEYPHDSQFSIINGFKDGWYGNVYPAYLIETTTSGWTFVRGFLDTLPENLGTADWDSDTGRWKTNEKKETK